MALEDTLNALKKIINKLNDANVSAIRLDNELGIIQGIVKVNLSRNNGLTKRDKETIRIIAGKAKSIESQIRPLRDRIIATYERLQK